MSSVHESGSIRSNAFWDQHLSHHHAAWHDALTNIHMCSQEPHLCIKTKLLAPSYQHVMMPSVAMQFSLFSACLLLALCQLIFVPKLLQTLFPPASLLILTSKKSIPRLWWSTVQGLQWEASHWTTLLVPIPTLMGVHPSLYPKKSEASPSFRQTLHHSSQCLTWAAICRSGRCKWVPKICHDAWVEDLLKLLLCNLRSLHQAAYVFAFSRLSYLVWLTSVILLYTCFVCLMSSWLGLVSMRSSPRKCNTVTDSIGQNCMIACHWLGKALLEESSTGRQSCKMETLRQAASAHIVCWLTSETLSPGQHCYSVMIKSADPAIVL